MPLLNTIATPYAEALLQISEAEGSSDRIAADAKGILELWNGSADLRGALQSPVLAPASKKATLRKLFEGRVSGNTLKLLQLLADRQRCNLLNVVMERFLELYRESQDIALAQITSATPLSREQQVNLNRKIQAIAGSKSVECSISVDPSLIGGLIIRIGSKVFDASLSGQARRLAVSLAKAI